MEHKKSYQKPQFQIVNIELDNSIANISGTNNAVVKDSFSEIFEYVLPQGNTGSWSDNGK